MVSNQALAIGDRIVLLGKYEENCQGVMNDILKPNSQALSSDNHKEHSSIA